MKLKCVPWEKDTLALSLGEIHPTLLDKDKILFNLSMMGRGQDRHIPSCHVWPGADHGRKQLLHFKTRPSALGMSDPVMEFLGILETQEFPIILKLLKGTKGA